MPGSPRRRGEWLAAAAGVTCMSQSEDGPVTDLKRRHGVVVKGRAAGGRAEGGRGAQLCVCGSSSSQPHAAQAMLSEGVESCRDGGGGGGGGGRHAGAGQAPWAWAGAARSAGGSGSTAQGSNQRHGCRVGQDLSLKRDGPQICSPHL
ncbi:hypothetical protein ACJBU6_08978 [Exserohilum turcicum]